MGVAFRDFGRSGGVGHVATSSRAGHEMSISPKGVQHVFRDTTDVVGVASVMFEKVVRSVAFTTVPYMWHGMPISP